MVFCHTFKHDWLSNITSNKWEILFQKAEVSVLISRLCTFDQLLSLIFGLSFLAPEYSRVALCYVLPSSVFLSIISYTKAFFFHNQHLPFVSIIYSANTNDHVIRIKMVTGWVIFHCTYVPYLPYPFVYWWTFRLLPCPAYEGMYLYVWLIHFTVQ